MNSIVILITVIIYSIYRLSITDNTEWITTYLPIILISILFITIIINVILMIRYMMIECKSKK